MPRHGSGCHGTEARTFPFPWLDPCESVRAQSNAHGHGRTPTSGRLNSPVRKLHKAVCRRFALKIRRCSPAFSSLSIGRSISTLLLYLPTLPDQTWKRFISVKYDLRFYLRILIFIASTLSPRVSESFGFYIFFFFINIQIYICAITIRVILLITDNNEGGGKKEREEKITEIERWTVEYMWTIPIYRRKWIHMRSTAPRPLYI